MAAIPPRTRRRHSWLLFAAVATANCGAVPTACASSAATSAATAVATAVATAAATAAATATAATVAAIAAASAISAADTTLAWALSLQLGVTGVESFSFDSFSSFSSSSSSSSPGGDSGAAGSGNGGSRQQRDRASCEPSDDPDYTCLLPHPPGSFEGEVKVYLSAEEELLSVKLVVLPASLSGSVDGGGGWASLGFSPNGKMAGPSEAVVGFAAAEDGSGGPSILRYRMEGYSTSSVTPLPDRHQVLIGQAVETEADGSLVVRFKRPFAATFSVLPLEGACVPTPMLAGAVEDQASGKRDDEEEKRGGGVRDGEKGGWTEEGNRGRWEGQGEEGGVAEGGKNGEGEEKEEREEEEDGAGGEGKKGDDGRSEEETLALEAAAVCSAGQGEVGRLDPREDGVVLLWAYTSRASWPSYHDATGVFPLPILGLES